MVKFIAYAGEDTPVLRIEADDVRSVPTSIAAYTKGHDGLVAYAQELQKDGATAAAITSRMGHDAYLVPETPQEGKKLMGRITKMLDESRQRISRPAEPEDADVRTEGEIVKTDPAKQNVFGWAYVTHLPDGTVNIDKSGDFVDEVEEIEETAYDFVLKSRQGDADHTNVKGATMIESMVFTPEKIEKMGLPAGSVPLGWWVGFHVEDKPTWARVEKGELTSFSVHGSGVRTKAEPKSS